MQIVFAVANILKIEPSQKLAKIIFSLIVNAIILSGYVIFLMVINF